MPGNVYSVSNSSLVEDIERRRAEVREFLRGVSTASNSAFILSTEGWTNFSARRIDYYGNFSTNEPDIMPRKLSKFQKFVKRVEHEPSNGGDLQSSHDDG
jgi:hypothetical protein